MEPIRLFAEASGYGNNQRPDILRRNPRGFGRQIILDVAVTELDGQSRPTEYLPLPDDEDEVVGCLSST